MAPRPLIIATLIGASVGVPYVTSQTKSAKSGVSGVPPATNYGHSTTTSQLPMVSSPYSTALPVAPPLAPAPVAGMPSVPGAVVAMPVMASRVALNGTQFTSIDQVLRFDVTKEWVYQNWDRKSTGPTDVGLMGVRVPLAMSPQMYALAGSLTYYFNEQGQVEHISFRGRTGDPAQLVQLVNSRYQLQRVQSLTGEQVYQAMNSGGQIQSELRTRPESVVQSSTPYQSVVVELELARPGSSRVLPPRPTGFEGLQAAQAQQAAAAAAAAQSAQASAAAAKAGSAAESGASSYYNKIRYASPQEESQVIWQRWPN